MEALAAPPVLPTAHKATAVSLGTVWRQTLGQKTATTAPLVAMTGTNKV